MLSRSPELRRCELLATRVEQALHEARALAIDGPSVPGPIREAVLRELHAALPALQRTIVVAEGTPLARRLWELGDLEDGLEAALGEHGWQPVPVTSIEPPALTERLDVPGANGPSF